MECEWKETEKQSVVAYEIRAQTATQHNTMHLKWLIVEL